MTKQLIYKYFAGNCSPEECAMVDEYLKGSDLRLLHDYMDNMAKNIANESVFSKDESDKLLGSIHQKINSEEKFHYIHQKINYKKLQVVSADKDDKIKQIDIYENKRKSSWKPQLRIAASITLILSIVAGSYQIWKRQGNSTKSSLSVSNWTMVDNASANVKELQMPDGTNIWLNAYSSLAFKKSEYNCLKREVRISGEVFFDVAHNASKPFIVRAGNISTTVLGTAFNIEAYGAEKDIRVILVRGKVRVKTGISEHILTPGQVLKYNNSNRQIAVNEIQTKDVNSWINGKLVFNDVPLQAAFNRIAQLYHIRIVVAKNTKLENKRLTGVFERKSPENVLNNILFVYKLNYHKKGGDYIVNP
ncbi:FecR family protein [Mucilaginibacter lappiensis]|jgi:transmembrane sensor|uniref:FecR family protein n=1 Tax=Mucilaginibacter lappiensis TaxID=354630 RepID=UPI003D227981